MTRANRDSFDLALMPVATTILIAIGADPKHGYAIMQDINESPDRRIQVLPGTVYAALKNLLVAGMIAEAEPPSNAGSDDSRRRYYRLTAAGRAAARAEVRRLASIVRLGRAFLS